MGKARFRPCLRQAAAARPGPFRRHHLPTCSLVSLQYSNHIQALFIQGGDTRSTGK